MAVVCFSSFLFSSVFAFKRCCNPLTLCFNIVSRVLLPPPPVQVRTGLSSTGAAEGAAAEGEAAAAAVGGLVSSDPGQRASEWGMGNVHAVNGLECKMSLQSYKLTYVAGTSDAFVRDKKKGAGAAGAAEAGATEAKSSSADSQGGRARRG